jgi:hypothetical protein
MINFQGLDVPVGDRVLSELMGGPVTRRAQVVHSIR